MSSFASHDEAQIPAILESARRKNAENGITGMLLYSNGTFMQVLEGGHEAVRATFETIKKDARYCTRSPGLFC